MRLLKGIWRFLVGVKDALVLIAMILFFTTLYAVLSARQQTNVASAGALLLDFSGSLVEQPAEAEPLDLISRAGAPRVSEYRLRDVVRAIRASARDANIKAVVLDLDGFNGGGQAAVASAGAALDEVRRAGKPVFAYATGYGDDSYQLAAHASEVWINPLGAVLLTGPGGSHLYYKGLLDKLGIEARVYKVGQFKSAVEPYIRNDQSPEARAANQALADALWSEWRGEVMRARPTAKLAAYLAAAARGEMPGANFAEAARAAGLADKVGDRGEFARRVAEVAGAPAAGGGAEFATVSLGRYIAQTQPGTAGDAIGVVTVAGDIVDGKAPPGTAGGETISRLLRDALATNRLKALVVRIDSPGGSVTASEQIRSAVLEAKRRGLPVVVSMGSVTASGGYWVASAGDMIFAEPSTITGSIGVFAILPTFRATLAKLGLSADGVKTTPLSGEPDVLRGPSPEVDKLLQAGVDQIYARFTGIVAASRHLPVKRVDEIAQGRVWAGGIARQIGLVDRFGGLDDAIAEAARRAKLDPGAVHPVFIEREPSYARRLLADMIGRSDDDASASASDPFAHVVVRPDVLLGRALGEARRVLAGPTIQVRCLECGTPAPAPSLRADGLATLLLARLGPG
ncbi:signal peptide peptidase SppA [Sphingomonas quercus]|uniref:Signal peptide peptidase SppA n=1 Tax=Sphingomonas quercus TaxID=2842451 RepID=A0ABS6BFS5_9SPHN|nr:signal peptide peptidase SppA [Sphingomonas quercus]MBU3077145.1 signal peptide peptidase SppA [Sphingomonas quercus]